MDNKQQPDAAGRGRPAGIGNRKVAEGTTPRNVTASLSPEAFNRLQRVKSMLDASSNTEAISRSLAVVEFLLEGRQKGRKLQYVGHNGRISDLEILG